MAPPTWLDAPHLILDWDVGVREDAGLPRPGSAHVKRGGLEYLSHEARGALVPADLQAPRGFLLTCDGVHLGTAREEGDWTLVLGFGALADVVVRGPAGEVALRVRRRRSLGGWQVEALDPAGALRWRLAFEPGEVRFLDAEGRRRATLHARGDLVDDGESGALGTLGQVERTRHFELGFTPRARRGHREMLLAAAFWLDRK